MGLCCFFYSQHKFTNSCLALSHRITEFSRWGGWNPITFINEDRQWDKISKVRQTLLPTPLHHPHVDSWEMGFCLCPDPLPPGSLNADSGQISQMRILPLPLSDQIPWLWLFMLKTPHLLIPFLCGCWASCLESRDGESLLCLLISESPGTPGLLCMPPLRTLTLVVI